MESSTYNTWTYGQIQYSSTGKEQHNYESIWGKNHDPLVLHTQINADRFIGLNKKVEL